MLASSFALSTNPTTLSHVQLLFALFLFVLDSLNLHRPSVNTWPCSILVIFVSTLCFIRHLILYLNTRHSISQHLRVHNSSSFSVHPSVFRASPVPSAQSTTETPRRLTAHCVAWKRFVNSDCELHRVTKKPKQRRHHEPGRRGISCGWSKPRHWQWPYVLPKTLFWLTKHKFREKNSRKPISEPPGSIYASLVALYFL
jgi:hypothetical protein